MLSHHTSRTIRTVIAVGSLACGCASNARHADEVQGRSEAITVIRETDPPVYDMRELEGPQGMTIGNRINNYGKVIGETTYPNYSLAPPTIWNADGTMGVQFGNYGAGLDINDDGWAVGVNNYCDFWTGMDCQPFLFMPDRDSILPPGVTELSNNGEDYRLGVLPTFSPGFYETSFAEGINRQGVIVGTSLAGYDLYAPPWRAFRFDSTGVFGPPGTLDDPMINSPFEQTFALAINLPGYIVGAATLPNDGELRAVLYNPDYDTTTDISVLRPFDTNGYYGGESQANDLNGSVVIVGDYSRFEWDSDDSVQHPWVWRTQHESTPVDLPHLQSGNLASATAINDRDEIVGWSTLVPGPCANLEDSHAVLWKIGQAHDLNAPGRVTAASNPRGLVFSYATDINNQGQIAAFAYEPSNPTYAVRVVLTPRPLFPPRRSSSDAY